MANPAPHTTLQTATHRMLAARKVTNDAVAREMAWVSIVVRAKLWPAWLSVPRKPQANMPYILNLDTPAGRLIYRIRDTEFEMFSHLPERPNDGVQCGYEQKMAILSLLAAEGWD